MNSYIARAALAATFLAAPAAAAPLVITETAGFGGAELITVIDGDVAFPADPFVSRYTSLAEVNKFNTANGVLTGARVRADFKVTNGRTVAGSGSTSGFAFGNSAGDVELATSAGVIHEQGFTFREDYCLASGGSSCLASYSATSQFTADASFGPISLNAFTGNGKFSAGLYANVAAQLTSVGGGFTLASYGHRVSRGPGSIAIDYSYLKHADASFAAGSDLNELVIDFGTVTRDAAVADIGFDLFNLGDGSTVGLDLDSLVGSGDTSAFGSNLNGFRNLVAGGSKAFFASFLTSTLGSFAATYQLNLSDADVGVGTQASQLTLRLMGKVVDRPTSTPVPEPSAIGLLGLGLMGLAARRRGRTAQRHAL